MNVATMMKQGLRELQMAGPPSPAGGINYRELSTLACVKFG